MTVRLYIGVDPGASGFICCLLPDTGMAQFIPNNLHPSQIFNTIKPMIDDYGPKIMIEDVHSLFGMSAKSNFQFGRNVGIIYAVLAATGQGIDLVTPKVWQKEIGAVLPKSIKKDRSKALKKMVGGIAERLYPNAPIFGPKGGLLDGKSDSLMIAHYCYLKYRR